MHRISEEEHFICYWRLFSIEYREYKKFIKYFQDQWINSKFRNWHYFNSFENGMLTNSFTESFNAVIKRTITNREALSIPELV